MRRWRAVAALVAAGAPGILTLVPLSLPAVFQQLQRTGQVAPPIPVLVIALALQPFILLVLSAAVGMLFASRLGLRSRIVASTEQGRAAWSGFEDDLAAAIPLGLLSALVIALLDLLTASYVPAPGASGSVLSNRSVLTTIVGVLYGGVTEEILVRWGVMSALAWFAHALTGTRVQAPSAGVMWAAIVVSALLFGLGHLPAAAMAGLPLTAAVIARIIVLNAIGGIIFGWLFWRRSLEAAMVAHAVAHLAWSAVALVGLAIR
jgi:CAAX prenyl protease-like protein